MAKSRRCRSPEQRIQVRLKVWLELDGQYVFGHGISQILEAVEATGSIKAAAEQLGKSYRYIWGRIKKAEQALGEPLVESRVGGRQSGRSSLTPRASRLLSRFQALRKRLFTTAGGAFPADVRPTPR